jgi:hypothetical protein
MFVVKKKGVGNIWSQPINGGKPVQITHFSEDEIYFFSLAPDGKSLACVRGRAISDAVLVSLAVN